MRSFYAPEIPMRRSTAIKTLLLLLLLGVLGWLLLPRLRGRSETPEVLPPSSEAAATSSPPGSPAFVVTGGRPLPQPGPPASEASILAARSHLRDGGQEGECGPYFLLGETTDPDLLGACERIGLDLDRVYGERFGVTPLGEPTATILLFDHRDSYRRFADAEGMASAGYAAFSVPARGYAAVWADATRRNDFARTLAHELTHLVNRRAVGGGLPRWLSEGLADAIGDTATPTGIQPLAGLNGVEGEATRLRMGLESGKAGDVERLFYLDDDAFDADSISYDYEFSAVLVRYLLSDPDLAPGFRAFLQELSGGAEYSPERLRQHLGIGWSDLGHGLQAWLTLLSE